MPNAKASSSQNTGEAASESEVEVEETQEEEEAPDDSEEESTEEEEEGGEEEGDSSAEYFDLAKVPGPLQAVAKKMQATHTRKMQALALDVRKAAALDDVMSHPSWGPFLADLESGLPYGASAKGSSARSRNVPDGDEEDEEATSGSDGKISMNKILKALMPAIEQVVQKHTGPLVTQQAERTWETTREKHPDFDDYLPEITKLLKAYPNMAPERAYRLAKAESDPQPRKATAKEAKKAKAARTLGPGVAKGNTQELKPQTAKTLRDALKGAFAAQGIRIE